MGDPTGYLYLVLGGGSLLHLWWQRDGVPPTQRRGRVVFGAAFVYAGVLSVLGNTSPAAIAVLGGLVGLVVYYAVQAWRREETWWHEEGIT